MLKVPQASLSASLASFSPPTYEYMAYAAVQMLPDETCLQIISCDEALFEEAQNAILLMPKGPALTFSQLMKKYYHGSLAALLETVTWGGRDERDSYLVEDLGAQYQSYRYFTRHRHWVFYPSRRQMAPLRPSCSACIVPNICREKPITCPRDP